MIQVGSKFWLPSHPNLNLRKAKKVLSQESNVTNKIEWAGGREKDVIFWVLLQTGHNFW